MERVKLMLPGNFYRPGFNTILGDPEPMFNFGMKQGDGFQKDVPYHVDNWVAQDHEWFRDEDIRASKKAAGDKEWWKVPAPRH